jgi:regulator of sigma E protease
MSLLIFIAILIALIWVHELGHFSVAKLFGIRVDEFAIGFPPRLFKVQYGETVYTFNLILVGGFVRIHGENPDDVAPGERDPRALTSKNRGVQAAVMLAGIAFNLIFAWVALSAGYMAGMPARASDTALGPLTAPKVLIGAVRPDSPADRAGIKPGDAIARIQTGTELLDTSTLSTTRQADVVQNFITQHQDESLVITLVRDGKEETVLAKPEAGVVEGRKVIGVEFGDVGILRLPPHLALVQGAIAFKDMTLATAVGLGSFFGQILVGQPDLSQVSGPIGIAGIGSDAVKAGFGTAAVVAALISINLALINLLPIPGLDGGRLLVLGIEAVIRRPVAPKIVNTLMLVGLAFIVILMVVVSVNDVVRLVG